MEELPPVPPSGFGGDLDGIEVTGSDLLGDLTHECRGTGAVVVDGETVAEQLAVAIHQTAGVGLAVDIDADQQGMGHSTPPSDRMDGRRPQRGENPWRSGRATASWQ